MPTGSAPAEAGSTQLVGRDGHIARVRALVVPGGAAVVCGEFGAGKTALLDVVADEAGAAGRRVLRVTGSESETALAFAGLHQLLFPVLDELDALPDRQRAPLRVALGLESEPRTPDPMQIRLAGLAALTGLAAAAPLLVVVDDAQWVDEPSSDVLAFAARRLGGTAVALLVGVREDAPLPGLGHDHPTVSLGPLDTASAHRLLDRRPRPPTGRRRVRVLDQAAGNPLALIDLADTLGDDPHLLPPSPRLERTLTTPLAAFTACTRNALLMAAVDPASGVSRVDTAMWAPAERAGLVRITDGQVRFSHPLVRAAIYHAASADERRSAHLASAAAQSGRPDRRAWHRAAATLGPDEEVAADLMATIDGARRGGGYAAAATVAERAAQLSPALEDRDRRLLQAAHDTIWLRQPSWAHDLLARIGTVEVGTGSTAHAALLVGRALVLDHRYSAALSALSQAAEQAIVADPVAAQDLIGTCAVVAYHSGSATSRELVRRLSTMSDNGPPGVGHAWTRAIVDPVAQRATVLRDLPGRIADAAGRPGELVALAVVAWLLDETPLALRLFDDGLNRWRAQGPVPDGMACAAWATYFEQGRWNEAADLAETASATTATADLPEVAASALTMRASLAAVRGDADVARELAATAQTLIDPTRHAVLGVRARWALGEAAVAARDYPTAFEHFRAMFTAEGEPVHYHASYPALADLAAVAVRVGRRDEAVMVLTASQDTLPDEPSPRLAALLHRSHALLAADQDHAEDRYHAALTVPSAAAWPFEYAQLLLDHGEWLRRRRRIAAARPQLTAALETFHRLGARPWADRAEAELRAAGVGHTRPARAPLEALTTQQQEILHLAARGLSNREIGERMYLSPRTVSSHLYRSFPKLGVTSRSQLHDLLVD